MKRVFAAAVLAASAVLLFARLGHYSLWDDEAGTALTARGILLAGDTTAELGRNLFAVNGGAELEGLRLRYMPPLQALLAAPFLAAAPASAFAARLPFAACALALVALMLGWLGCSGAGPGARAVFAAALFSCASFFLFGRQARYYAPAMLFTAAAAWQYVFWDGTRWRAFALAGWSIALLATNYLNFAAFWACLAVDRTLWGRKTARPAPARWAQLLIPQIAAAALLLSVWNPLGKSPVTPVGWSAGAMLDSFWYALRDLHRAQFLPLPLLVAAFLLRLPRPAVAVLVYAAAVAVLAPLPASGPRVAQIRYLAPLMPLGFLLAVSCAEAVPARLRRWALPAALLLFLPGLRTTAAFIGELADPPGEPYAPAARWIAENVREGETVGVFPDYAMYPLMFHAPNATYAWQLPWPPPPRLEGLPDIHYRGREAPDYVVVFGPAVEGIRGGRYELAATLDAYWRDEYRPELFWRRFTARTDWDRSREAVYVLRRKA